MSTFTTIEHITDRNIKVTTRIGEHVEQTLINTPETPRPLTADDITDEMVDRARKAYNSVYASGAWTEGIRAALRAALTPPPPRPEGAEKVEAVLNQYWSGDVDGTDLADLIVEEMNR